LYREVIERKPEEFKIGCLKDISALFPNNRSPLYAGFGNKINDTFAYRAVGIPISRIFTVNPKGELRMDMTLSFQSSYTKLSDIVDHFFPPLLHCDCHNEVIESGKFPGATEYSDFTYWRDPIPDIENEITILKAQVEEEKKTVGKTKHTEKDKRKEPMKKEKIKK
jgi:phosphatidate phosphatase LPIN